MPTVLMEGPGTSAWSSEDPLALRSNARLAVLVEFCGLFAHEIGNPIQCMTTCLELGMADPRGPDEVASLRQSLLATEQLHALSHHFSVIARASRDAGRLGCDTLCHALLGVVDRRLDRFGVRRFVRLEALEGLHLPPIGLEFPLLDVLLGVVATVAYAGLGGYQLEVHGEHPHASDRAWLRIALCSGGELDDALRPLTISPRHVGRARDALDPSVRFDVRGDQSLVLEFPVLPGAVPAPASA